MMKPKKYILFDNEKLEPFRKQKLRDSDVDAKRRSYAERLDKHGALRILVQIPAASALNRLERDMPNFIEVINFVRQQIALCRLASAGERAVAIMPILLLGQPGVGKTRFASKLANALRVNYHEISFATTSATFVLKGGNLQWGDGHAGRIFEILADSVHMNPLVLIDEVDKSLRGNYQPINILYELLEPLQASKFQDEAMGDVWLDASRVIWILTANKPNMVPDAIFSRCRVFEIPVPAKEQMHRIAQSVYRDVLSGQPWAKKFEARLRADVMKALAVMAPRDMRKILQDALGRAAVKKLNRVTVDAIPVIKAKRKIGFK